MTAVTSDGHWMVARDGVIHLSGCRHCPKDAAVYRSVLPKTVSEMLTHIAYTPYLSACQECVHGCRYG